MRRGPGLVGEDGWFTPAGRQLREDIESMTDLLDAPASASLEPSQLRQLIADLEPVAAVLTS